MKKLLLLLLLPILGWSQEIKDIPYIERDWYKFRQSDLELVMIDTPEEWVIQSTPYMVNIHGVATFLLYGKLDSILKYKEELRYINWEIAFKYSMYYYHDTLKTILVSEFWDDEEENCGCVDHLLEAIFSEGNIIYKNITLGDVLKSKRLKEYELVFYNTLNKQPNSTIYQHELVVYYKLKWNPLLKSHRETRKGIYIIPFKEVVLDSTQMD